MIVVVLVRKKKINADHQQEYLLWNENVLFSPKYSKWRIDPPPSETQYTLGRKLGAGHFGQVFLVLVNNRQLAVKIFRSDLTQEEQRICENEYELMK